MDTCIPDILRQLKKDIEKYTRVLSSFIWENINRDKLTSKASQDNFEKKVFNHKLWNYKSNNYSVQKGGGAKTHLCPTFESPWVINPERESTSPIVLTNGGAVECNTENAS